MRGNEQGDPAGMCTRGDNNTPSNRSTEIENAAQEKENIQDQVQQKSLQEIIDMLPAPVFYKDEKGAYLGCNASFESLLGVPKKEIIGKTLFDLLPKKVAEMHRKADDELMEKLEKITYEAEILSHAGKRYEAILSKAAMRNPDGKISGIVGIISDVTGRGQYEEAIHTLIESTVGQGGQAFFDKTVEKLCDWLDADCAIIGEIMEDNSVNALAMNLDGKRVDNYSYELFGTPCEMVVKEGFSIYPEGVSKLFPEDRDLEVMKAEGYIGSVLRDSEKKAVGVFCAVSRKKLALPGRVRDVMEIISAKAAVEIEHLRAQRALRLATEKAEAANQAKSAFISQMSHELRTPLTAVLGYAQLLDQSETIDRLGEIEKESIREILSAGWHLYALITDLLNLSGIESGQMSLSVAPVSVKPLVRDVLSTVKPIADKTGISLIDETASMPDRHVNADEIRLKQVLFNLVSNAIKYNNPKGSVIVSCRYLNEDVLRISVADTGTGISKEEQKRIFRPFDRAGAEKRGIDGVGIGLYISRKLIGLMGGRIGLESKRGQGSTFWIELINGQEESPTISSECECCMQEPISKCERMFKLLYIEDDLSIINLFRQILSKRPDITLLTAQGAIPGLELAASECPDIILLDINLPGMDGFEILERLRAEETTKDTPVLALSAYAMDHDIERGLNAGFLHYLTKPIKNKELMAYIDAAVEARRASVD